MPRLPQIRLSYGTELTQEYRRKRLSMGDGYSVRAQDGLNAAPQRWKLVWENIPNADAEMLRQFFKDLGGVDLIRWQPFDQLESLLWTAGGFSSQPSTFGKRTCSAMLEQEFDLVGPAPVNTALPTISGVTTVGEVLTGSNGTWTNSPDDYFYRWLRAGQPIEGAIGQSYLQTPDDAGQQLTFEVSAGNLGGETIALSASVTTNAGASNPTPPPAPTLDNTRANSDTVYVSNAAFTAPFTSIQDQIAALEA